MKAQLTNNPSVKWSQTLKSSNILINSVSAQRINPNGQYQYCMNEEPLSLTTKTQWCIKIKKMFGYIAVGICLKNLIREANYQLTNYKDTGHGGYIIFFSGHCYSHTDKKFNYAGWGFTFATGDIIYLQFDPIGSKLRFRKKDKPQNIQLIVPLPPQGDQYHICANLYHADEVELIDSQLDWVQA